MFDNRRYITKGVNEEIDINTQISLWNFVDDLKNKNNFKLDYLQVFQLKEIIGNSAFNQEIIHYQEEIPYKKYYLMSVQKPINSKIYVIDDSQQSVMMLSIEY